MHLQSFTLIPKYCAPSSWWQHVPLAHWLVEVSQPKFIVELGTHYGVSFFAFCDAAEKLSPQTMVFAVDTWQGDEHAGNYGDTVYKHVYDHWFKAHRRTGSLIRSTFDEASSYFPDHSIDLLHIDGLHTYEAVKNDFETWLPKLKKGSIVLFHDINVRERQFGAWRFWQELSKQDGYRCYTVNSGYGLGILYLDQQEPEWSNELELALPILTSKGELLESLAELTPGGSFSNQSFSVLLEQAENRAHEAEQNEQQALIEADLAKAEIRRIQNSKLWRLTQPIRSLHALFLGSKS